MPQIPTTAQLYEEPEISTGQAPGALPVAPPSPTSPASSRDPIKALQYLLAGATDSAGILSAQRHGRAAPSNSLVGDLLKADAVEQESRRRAQVDAVKLDLERKKLYLAASKEQHDQQTVALKTANETLKNNPQWTPEEKATYLQQTVAPHLEQIGLPVDRKVLLAMARNPELMGKGIALLPWADPAQKAGLQSYMLRVPGTADGLKSADEQIVGQLGYRVALETQVQGYNLIQAAKKQGGSLTYPMLEAQLLATTPPDKQDGVQMFLTDGLGGTLLKGVQEKWAAAGKGVGLTLPSTEVKAQEAAATAEASAMPDVDEAALLRVAGITKAELKKRTPQERSLLAQAVKKETVGTAGELARAQEAGRGEAAGDPGVLAAEERKATADALNKYENAPMAGRAEGRRKLAESQTTGVPLETPPTLSERLTKLRKSGKPGDLEEAATIFQIEKELSEARASRTTVNVKQPAQLPAGSVEKLADIEGFVDRLKEVRKLHKSQYTGPADQYLGWLKEKTGIAATKEETVFRQLLSGLKNEALNLRSGQAVTASEYERLLKEMPTESDPDPVFLAKAETAARVMADIAKRRRGIYEDFGFRIPKEERTPTREPEPAATGTGKPTGKPRDLLDKYGLRKP